MHRTKATEYAREVIVGDESLQFNSERGLDKVICVGADTQHVRTSGLLECNFEVSTDDARTLLGVDVRRWRRSQGGRLQVQRCLQLLVSVK